MAYYLSPIANAVKFVDEDGAPLDLGKIYTYDAGTTNLRGTKSDIFGSINQNPSTLVGGVPDFPFWLDKYAYRFVVKTSDDLTTILDIDNVVGYAPSSVFRKLTVSTLTGNTTIDETYRGKFIVVDSASIVTLTLSSSNTEGFNCQVLRKGSGAVNLSGRINGTSSSTYSIATQWQVAQVVSIGTNDPSVITLG